MIVGDRERQPARRSRSRSRFVRTTRRGCRSSSGSTLHDTTVTIDGRVALLLPRKAPRAGRARRSTKATRRSPCSPARRGEQLRDTQRCEAGMAQAAFIFPVTHGTALRVAMPLSLRAAHAAARARRGGACRRAPAFPTALPSGAQVAQRMARRSCKRGMQLELPDERMQQAIDANRAFMLLFHDGDEITPGPMTYHRFWFRDAAYLLAALDRYGFHDEAAQVLASYPGRQHVDGFFFSQRQEWDAQRRPRCGRSPTTGACTRDATLLAPMAASIAKGVHWIERKRRIEAPPSRREPEGPAAGRHLGGAPRARSTTSTGTTSGRSRACARAPSCSARSTRSRGAADTARLAAAMWRDVAAFAAADGGAPRARRRSRRGRGACSTPGRSARSSRAAPLGLLAADGSGDRRDR